MKSIGGYFELELSNKNEYHVDAIRLNTGRNALEYIMLSKKYNKVYLPYYTCDVLLQPIQKNAINFEFYSIDEKFEPLFDFSKIADDECFLYTNYFGLKDEYLNVIASFCKNLIIDNAQSFYSMPINQVDTFYSPRKFFGVSDGAYLYCSKKLDIELEQDISINRMSHLLIRADKNAEVGYSEFSKNDSSLINQPIKKMSNLTHKILDSINYESVKSKRIQNFEFLHQFLKDRNLFVFEKPKTQIPLVYPFWTKDVTLKKRLLENKIYCANYWPNVQEWCSGDSLEVQLTKELIHLPIDQRYDLNDMRNILKYV